MLPDLRSKERRVTRTFAQRQTRSSVKPLSHTKPVRPLRAKPVRPKAVKVPPRPKLINHGLEKTPPMSPMASADAEIPPISLSYASPNVVSEDGKIAPTGVKYVCPKVNVFEMEGMLTSVVAKVFGKDVESHRRLFPQGRLQREDVQSDEAKDKRPFISMLMLVSRSFREELTSQHNFGIWNQLLWCTYSTGDTMKIVSGELSIIYKMNPRIAALPEVQEPIQELIRWFGFPMLKLLIEKMRYNPNCIDTQGKTILMKMVTQYEPELTMLLLDLHTCQGGTPKDKRMWLNTKALEKHDGSIMAHWNGWALICYDRWFVFRGIRDDVNMSAFDHVGWMVRMFHSMHLSKLRREAAVGTVGDLELGKRFFALFSRLFIPSDKQIRTYVLKYYGVEARRTGRFEKLIKAPDPEPAVVADE